MHLSRCTNRCIANCSRMMGVELGSAQSHLRIDGEHTALKVPQHLTSQPCAESSGSFYAVSFYFKNANFNLLQADRRDEEILGINGSCPSR